MRSPRQTGWMPIRRLGRRDQSERQEELRVALGDRLLTCRLEGDDFTAGGVRDAARCEVVVTDGTPDDSVTNIVTAHDPAQSTEERLDDEPTLRQGRVLAAVTLRASSQWAGLTAQQKARVMAVIDQAATRLIQLLS